ncbi:MAG: 6-bladed beta-propeller [Gemmatimonadota bacterium]
MRSKAYRAAGTAASAALSAPCRSAALRSTRQHGCTIGSQRCSRRGKAAQVLVFDSNGGFVRRIGRKGQGPGEFGSVTRLWLTNDTLVVTDTVNVMTTLLSPDGRPLQLWSQRHHQGTMRPWASGPSGWHAFLMPRRARFPTGMYAGGDTVVLGRVDLPNRTVYRYLPDSGVVTALIHQIPVPPRFVHQKSERYFHITRPLFSVEPSYCRKAGQHDLSVVQRLNVME